MIEEKNRFLTFLKQQKGMLVVVVVFSILAYGFKVFFYSNQFDTVQMSVKYKNILEWWISIGRYALVATKSVLENGFFNVYFSNFVTLILMILCPVVWSYTIHKYAQNNSKIVGSYWVFGILFVTTPIMVEQISFSLQNWEVMLAYILTALATCTFFEACFMKKRCCYFISALLMGWTMGIYQNFISVFVMGILVVIFLRLEDLESNIRIWKIVLILLSVCLGGFLIYEAGNKIAQSITGIEASEYLKTNIKWFAQPIKESIYAIYIYIRDLIFSNSSPYSSVIYGIIFVLFVLEGIWSKSKFLVWNIILRLGIVSSPFYFAFLFGNSVGLRVQTILPITVAFTGWYLVEKIAGKRNALYMLCTVFVSIFALKNAQIMCQAFYSDYCAYNNDVRIAEEIRLSAGEAFPENPLENIVFVNAYAPKSSIPNNIFQENIGSSIFGLTWLNDYDRQTRITDFYNYLGYSAKYWTWEEYSYYKDNNFADLEKNVYGEYVLYSLNGTTLVQFR